jgi:carbamoylphosphate synthase large subunit
MLPHDIRALVISTKRWPIPARVAVALAEAGFRVAAISPRRDFVSRTRAIQRRFYYQIDGQAKSIVRAIEEWAPQFLVCTDDQSVQQLHQLHMHLVKTATTKKAKDIAALIETSLGSPRGFDFASEKSRLLVLAKSLEVRCPETRPISKQTFERQIETAVYPLLVKGDGSWGGRFVRIVENAKQAKRVVCEFQLPADWPMRVRGAIAKCLLTLPGANSYREKPVICLQQFIGGRPANRAVVCWEGQVLAGVSVRVHETVYAFGPAALVEPIESAEMTVAANILVKYLKLSGFIGFDFVLDHADRAWLVEMNARVTPLTYANMLRTPSLAAILFAKLAGANLEAPSVAIRSGIVALFPQELQRSVRSKFISAAFDDVPWNEPELVLALLKSVLEGGTRKRMGMKRRNSQKSLLEQLQRER